MRRLGTVLHVSSHGHIILRGEAAPRENTKVVDKKLREIGRVIDIFGPVKKPYISVKPGKRITNYELRGLKGERLYTK